MCIPANMNMCPKMLEVYMFFFFLNIFVMFFIYTYYAYNVWWWWPVIYLCLLRSVVIMRHIYIYISIIWFIKRCFVARLAIKMNIFVCSHMQCVPHTTRSKVHGCSGPRILDQTWISCFYQATPFLSLDFSARMQESGRALLGRFALQSTAKWEPHKGHSCDDMKRHDS